jgi:hypothetical protein
MSAEKPRAKTTESDEHAEMPSDSDDFVLQSGLLVAITGADPLAHVVSVSSFDER